MINQLLGAFILSMKVDVTLFVLEKLEVPEHNPPASQPSSSLTSFNFLRGGGNPHTPLIHFLSVHSYYKLV
jgi:hypothetical protein